ncbi:MAG: hypothetical protein JWN38_89 [Candidatus Saccharibacteria bacterium]|nr:hypothetical protein [Candidatus Saccharibacteria bacterium]
MTINELVQTPERPSPLVELKFEIDPDGHAAAYLPTRWCVNAVGLLPRLREREFKKPHLLICVRHVQQLDRYGETFTDFTNTAFYVVPLEQELQYVTFNRSGTNQVLAAIVDVTNGKIARALHHWERNPDKAPRDLFSHEGRLTMNYAYDRSSRQDMYLMETGTLETVSVDAAMFAKPRAAWRTKLVSTFFRSKPRDECHFRKREWFVVWPALVVLSVPVFVLKAIVALVAAFLGFYFVDYKSVFQPLKLFPTEPIENVEANRYRHKKPESANTWSGEFQNRFIGWMVINPPVLLVPAAITFGIFNIPEHHGTKPGKVNAMGWWQTLLTVDAWILGIVLAATVVMLVLSGCIVAYDRLTGSPSRAAQREAREREAELREQEKLFQQLQDMSCSTASSNVAVAALPKEKQTPKLRFAQTKGKVCKPFEH